jgi:hypothetical protein
MIPVVILFAGRERINPYFSSGKERLVLISAMLVFLIFSAWNLIFLPVIDFMPYKTGIKIADQMVIPEGAAADVYQTTFIYEKDGNRKEFTLSDYPADDTSWIFIDQKSILVKKGYQPPVHDFRISTFNGEDITEKLINGQGKYSLLMITKKLGEADKKHLEAGFELGKKTMAAGIDFYIVTASGSDEAEAFKNGLIFCSGDETTLKTMLRANPGYMLIRDGVIVGKWSWANVPKAEWFTEYKP